MSARIAPKAEAVKTCTERRDGSFLIVTLKGRSGVSETPICEGGQVIINEGVARKVAS